MENEPWKDSMTRIPINPELLTWARKRACLPDRQAGLDALALVRRLEPGESRPREGTHE